MALPSNLDEDRLCETGLAILGLTASKTHGVARACLQRAGAVIAEDDLRSMPSPSQKPARSVRTGMDPYQLLRTH